jgi:hypothetical protein
VNRIEEDNAKKKGKTGAELEPTQSAVKLFLETEAQRPRRSGSKVDAPELPRQLIPELIAR